MKNIIAVVAARGGSKGVPGKNIRLLGGKPLIAHILDTLGHVEQIDRVIVSTDSDEIAGVVTRLALPVELRMRPAHLAEDGTPLTSVAQFTAKQLESEGYVPEIVLQVAPTCPFITAENISKTIDPIVSGKTNCVATLFRIEHAHPYRAKELKADGSFEHFIKDIEVEKFISRQTLPELYATSGAIYARTWELLKTFTGKDFCLGPAPHGVVVDDIEAVNIDRPLDFEFAEFLAAKRERSR